LTRALLLLLGLLATACPEAMIDASVLCVRAGGTWRTVAPDRTSGYCVNEKAEKP
jgi:hypothetical protein